MCVHYHIAGGTLDRRNRFFFFVKNDFFLKLVDECQNDETQHVNFPRILAWDEWGVDNTRFMAYGMQPRWLRLAPRFMSSRPRVFCHPGFSVLGARTPANQTWFLSPR